MLGRQPRSISEIDLKMNIEQLLKLGTEYFSSYLTVLISTLRAPGERFRPLPKSKDKGVTVLHAGISASYIGPGLSPQLFGFMIISVLIGATLNSVVPGRPPSPDFLTTSVVTISVWIGYSISVFLLCKILGGKGSFLETMSVSLQLLAVVYVVSNFVTFIWGSIVRPSVVRGLLQSGILRPIVDYPILIYYPVQFFLMLIYLPLALKHVHRLNRVRQIVVAVVPVVWTFWAIVSFSGNLIGPLTLATITPLEPFPIVAPTRGIALTLTPSENFAEPLIPWLTPTTKSLLILMPTPSASPTMKPTDWWIPVPEPPPESP